jgi:O-6-methylguanine DNA methyltransferase
MIDVYAQNISGTWFAVAFNNQQVVTSSFGAEQQTALKNVLYNLPLNMPFQVFHQPSPIAKAALLTLSCIYRGQEIKETPPLATSHLPLYTKKVLKATSMIPLGYVTCYGLISQAVGGGPRAVGNIMASNPFAPIIPCHRVVKSDFSLGGYGFGLKAKVDLLTKEQRGFTVSKEIPVNGSQLTVFPVENVLKFFT